MHCLFARNLLKNCRVLFCAGNLIQVGKKNTGGIGGISDVSGALYCRRAEKAPALQCDVKQAPAVSQHRGKSVLAERGHTLTPPAPLPHPVSSSLEICIFYQWSWLNKKPNCR